MVNTGKSGEPPTKLQLEEEVKRNDILRKYLGRSWVEETRIGTGNLEKMKQRGGYGNFLSRDAGLVKFKASGIKVFER